MVSREKFCATRSRQRCGSNPASRAQTFPQLLVSMHREPGFPVNHHFGHRPPIVGQHRGAAGHGLYHGQPKVSSTSRGSTNAFARCIRSTLRA